MLSALPIVKISFCVQQFESERTREDLVRHYWETKCQTKVAEKEDKIERLENELNEKGGKIERLENELNEKEDKIEELGNKIAEKDDQIKRMFAILNLLGAEWRNEWHKNNA